MMTKNQAFEFCKDWLAAWSGNQPQELAQFYAENVFYRDPAKPTGLRTKKDLVSYFEKLLAKYPHWIWTAVEVFPTDLGFNLKWEAKVSSHPATKSFFGLDIVEVENGLITRNEVYFDPSDLQKV